MSKKDAAQMRYLATLNAKELHDTIHCGIAVKVVLSTSAWRSASGADIPDEMQPVYLASVDHLMGCGLLEPFFCEHGDPNMRFTAKFYERTGMEVPADLKD